MKAVMARSSHCVHPPLLAFRGWRLARQARNADTDVPPDA
jgi:hypothetical protein